MTAVRPGHVDAAASAPRVSRGLGERVLDVAAGNGNASLPAARRFADVLTTDDVPALLEEAQRRADADGLTIRTQEADAQALPVVAVRA